MKNATYARKQKIVQCQTKTKKSRYHNPSKRIHAIQLAFTAFTLALLSVLVLFFVCNRVWGFAPSITTSARFFVSALDFGRGRAPTLMLSCSLVMSVMSKTSLPPLLRRAATLGPRVLLVESPNNIPRPSNEMFSFDRAGLESRFFVGEFCSASES